MDKVDLASGTVSEQDGGGMRDAEHRGVGTLVGVKNPRKQEICLPTEKLGVTVWVEIEVVMTWQEKLMESVPLWYCWAGQRDTGARLGREHG